VGNEGVFICSLIVMFGDARSVDAEVYPQQAVDKSVSLRWSKLG